MRRLRAQSTLYYDKCTRKYIHDTNWTCVVSKIRRLGSIQRRIRICCQVSIALCHATTSLGILLNSIGPRAIWLVDAAFTMMNWWVRRQFLKGYRRSSQQTTNISICEYKEEKNYSPFDGVRLVCEIVTDELYSCRVCHHEYRSAEMFGECARDAFQT